MSMNDNNMNINAVKSLQNIMTEFNFDKVQSVMEFLGWEWHPLGRTPDKYEIMNRAFELLIEAYERYWDSETKTTYYIRTGGLSVSYEYIDDNEYDEIDKHYFTLEFVVECSM